MLFQALHRTLFKEYSFKWKHQSYLIHGLRNATKNTLGAKEQIIQNNRIAWKTWKITPVGRIIKQHKLKKTNGNSMKKLSKSVIQTWQSGSNNVYKNMKLLAINSTNSITFSYHMVPNQQTALEKSEKELNWFFRS